MGSKRDVVHYPAIVSHDAFRFANEDNKMYVHETSKPEHIFHHSVSVIRFIHSIKCRYSPPSVTIANVRV
jgi:hypothetical protein